MTLRTGMTALVSEVRAMTGAGTADWSDDQVQTFLDRTREDYLRAPVTFIPRQEPGSVVYRTFYLPAPMETGTALVLTESGGGTIGTADYSIDADTGLGEFGTSHAAPVYADVRVYDPNLAGANLLEQWAGAVAIDSWGLTQDQQTLSRRERVDALMAAAKRLRARVKPRKARLVRKDG